MVISGLLILGALVWWLIFETEGVYLGKRVVIWLYDVYANRYDSIKEFDEVNEHLYLAQPIIHQLEFVPNPLILDVATGTGRLPLALFQHARFEGEIIGVDLSWKMLRKAQAKLDVIPDIPVTLMRQNAEKLSFPSNIFDVVICLEALEFMPHPEQALTEIIRVLKADGLLLITNRIRAPLFVGRIWSEEYLQSLLEQNGITQIEFEEWQWDYNKVWGRKVSKSVH